MLLQVPSESLNLQRNTLGPKLFNHTSLEISHSFSLLMREKTSLLGGPVLCDSFPPLNLTILPQSSESHPFKLQAFPIQDIPVGGRLAHILEHWGEINQKEWVLSIIQKVLRIQFCTPSTTNSSYNSESIFLSLIRRKVLKLLQKQWKG